MPTPSPTAKVLMVKLVKSGEAFKLLIKVAKPASDKASAVKRAWLPVMVKSEKETSIGVKRAISSRRVCDCLCSFLNPSMVESRFWRKRKSV